MIRGHLKSGIYINDNLEALGIIYGMYYYSFITASNDFSIIVITVLTPQLNLYSVITVYLTDIRT